jgi:enoyl-CoA hydratase
VEELVRYEQGEGVATITMDDGKVNVLSLAMFDQLGRAFDRAEAEGMVVVLTGREGRFSGGFDLAVLQGGSGDAVGMLMAGFELSHRLLAFPAPIVTAVSGHAIAMGAFLVLSTDHRIGVQGAAHRIVANEVAIGLPMPWTATEVMRQRLTPAAFQQAANLAVPYTPDAAVAAGFLDVVVPEGTLADAAHAAATAFAGLDRAAHTATKRRVREATLAAVAAAVEADRADLEAVWASG